MRRFRGLLGGMAAVVLVSSALTLGGCVYSDTITDVILNNSENSEIDPSITPVLVNTSTAVETSDSLPKLEDGDSETADNSESATPFYTTNPDKVTTDAPAPRPVYAKNVDAAGETAAQADEEVVPDTEITQDSEQEDDEQPDEGVQKKRSDTGRDDPEADSEDDERDDDDAGDGGEGEGGGLDVGEGGGGGEEAPVTPEEPEGPSHVGGTGAVYTGDADREPEIPEGISRVAAVGNYAVIVSVVSGTPESTALVACDEATKNKTSALLAARGMALPTASWSGDGSLSGSVTEESFQELVETVQPHLVFLEEGSGSLTDDQIAALTENDIDIYYLPKLTSAKRIRFAVQVIGMTLAKGGVEGAESAYKSYLEFEDAQVAKYLDDDHNGGIAGGYDLNLDKDAQASASGVATLFIDKWDVDARHKESFIDTDGGVAVATLGFKTAPVSYYMSVGGALNNASSRAFRLLTGSGVVWQFAQNEFGYRFGSWSNLDIATYDLCSRVTGGIYISDLLWNTYELGMGYGTDAFPAVVTKSRQLKQRMDENSKSTRQLYFAYPLIHPAGGNATTIGLFKSETGSGSYVESCIGRSSGDGRLEAASPENCQVFVNPKGLCQQDAEDKTCSWTDGSIESVLEAGWVYWRFHGGGEAEFKQDVTDFYKKFYGYDITAADYDAIVAGVAS